MPDFSPVVPPPRGSGFVRLNLFPSDTHNVVLEMGSTLGTSTAFVAYQNYAAAALALSGHTLDLRFPTDGVRRYFRARHEADGYTAGAYTREVSAIPSASPPSDVPLAEATMKAYGHLSASVGIDVGTPAQDSTSILKILTVTGRDMAAQNYDDLYNTDVTGYIRPGSSTGFVNFFKGVFLPSGVTVSAVSGNFYRGSTLDEVDLKLNYSTFGSTGGVGGINVVVAHSFSSGTTGGGDSSAFGGNFRTGTSSGVDHLVSSDNTYWVSLQLNSTVTGSNARFYQAEIEYTMDQYEKTY